MGNDAIKIAATPQSVKWGFFDASTPSITSVASGTEVIIDTVSGDAAYLPSDDGFEILPEHRPILKEAERGAGPHFLTGPINVDGAEPGDVLAVDILDITLRQNWGFNLIIPLQGTIPDDFPDFILKILPIDKQAKTVTLPWGGKLALSPFFGVMGVAPPPNWGRITSVIPRTMGGNMDNKELVAGTTVYFPVYNKGAQFSVGDGHGVQGDGEVCITALETALTGHFRLSVRKDMELTAPRAETPTHYITMGFDEDLDDAVRQALRDMIRWIGELRGLSKTDAYTLCSLAADLHVTQMVNMAKGAHCMLPKSILG
ncbi:acetamidase/formamidase family protein [Bradyrhizobium sp. dw_78]|uniref:acetamidase/formamidase family protein n=1 Tax=Bradyrhizobium sp. dw_78 TaxID=2719793 RepID=UPI001BD57806|nr:acetamidase/formamidase family protein [Bradyrhizobium sp. dw_78]